MSVVPFNTACGAKSLSKPPHFKFRPNGAKNNGAANENCVEDEDPSSSGSSSGLTGILTSLVGLMRITITPMNLSMFEPDVFCLLPQRLLGYGFAVDEALRFANAEEHIGPFSFLAGSFIITHCFYRTCLISQCTSYEQGSAGSYAAIMIPPEQRLNRNVTVFCGTLLYEVLVSFFFPPIIVSCVCRFTDAFLETIGVGSDFYRRWTPVVMGLAMLPPIGMLVDRAVQMIIRHFLPPLYFRTMEFKW